jgi:hypothetical protein
LRLNGVPTVSKNRATVPQKPEGRKQPASPTKEFDPALFATKLEYVEDLGISEENGVGENRGRLYVALRDEFGFTAGFVAVENPKFPKQLLKNEHW